MAGPKRSANHMKDCILLMLIGVLFYQKGAASDAPQLKPGYALDIGTHRGTAILSLPTDVEKKKDILSVDIRFTNKGGCEQFYNAFFNMHLPRPAMVALFDHDGNYICDMIAFIKGSRANVHLNSWQTLGDDCYVGTILRLPIHNVPNGKYSLQVIFFHSFISIPPTQQELSERPWFGGNFPNFDSRELFRSNAITIFVKDGRVEQNATERPPPAPDQK